MVPAELAAWTNGGPVAGPGQIGQRGVEEGQLLLGEPQSPSAGPSATARWVHTPCRARSGLSADQIGQEHGVSGLGADPVHAGVDLEVDRERGSDGRRGGGRRANPPFGVHRGHQVSGHRLGHGVGRRFGQEQDRRLDPRFAQRHSLFHQGHGQPGRAPSSAARATSTDPCP